MEKITIALAKGRLAKQTIALLETLGITCQQMKKESRKLIFKSDEGTIQFFLSKATDVPTYVEYGCADIGIVGKDTILEENRSVYEVLDLGFGQCEMIVAGEPEKASILQSGQTLKVATKYPNIAKAHFEKTHRDVEIIKLNGSVELGPIVGLADVIVDIVESGATLKENGLVVLENIVPLSARCIVNTASFKLKNQSIKTLLKSIEETLGEDKYE